MFRVALVATVLSLSSVSLAHAQSDSSVDDSECRKQGQIATNIMSERKNGSNARRAERRVIRALPEDAKKYKAAIPALVEWIYSLPDNQLGPDVSNALYQSCLSSQQG